MAGAGAPGGVVIVGAGIAGWTIARELRQRDSGVVITLVCADAGHFYSKPMLSNALAQKKDAEQIVQRPAAQQAQTIGARIVGAARVLAIDRGTRQLQTTAGEIPYDQLVLALGADPIRLATPGLEHAHSVNDVDDYRAFRNALAKAGAGARVAIIGGGLIGSEFANDLLIGGYRVDVIDPAKWLLGNLVSQEQGRALQAALDSLGAGIHVDDIAEKVQTRIPSGFQLSLRSGRTLEADLILSAVGLRPRVQLAQAAGLVTSRGIEIDELGRTSDPDIFALGDCAAYASAARPDIANGAPRPLPYIMPVMTAAKAIAATLAGNATPIRFGPMPVRVKTPALPLTVAG